MQFTKLNSQISILVTGRLLSGIGSGLTLFYASIFFASDRFGMTKTAVGFAVGSAAISGVLGRFLSGLMTDSPIWGRRRTLLISALVSTAGSFVLATAWDFPSLVAGNLLAGLGVGLYWPAIEAAISDLTETTNRQEAYAINRLADNIGLGLGIILGGAVIAMTGAYRALFIADGISFSIFFAIIYRGILDDRTPAKTAIKREITEEIEEIINPRTESQENGWRVVLSDRPFLVYIAANIAFTTYISQVHTTMPLYFSEFVSGGLPPEIISAIFTWHLVLCIIFQLPVAQSLRRLSHARALIFSALFWGAGFLPIALAGLLPIGQLAWILLGSGILAIATVSYTPSASSLVAELAPPSLRGLYHSLNAQCWAAGFFIGPILGGWALDRPRPLADALWPGLALSVGATILILLLFERILSKSRAKAEHRSN